MPALYSRSKVPADIFTSPAAPACARGRADVGNISHFHVPGGNRHASRLSAAGSIRFNICCSRHRESVGYDLNRPPGARTARGSANMRALLHFEIPGLDVDRPPGACPACPCRQFTVRWSRILISSVEIRIDPAFPAPLCRIQLINHFPIFDVLRIDQYVSAISRGTGGCIDH